MKTTLLLHKNCPHFLKDVYSEFRRENFMTCIGCFKIPEQQQKIKIKKGKGKKKDRHHVTKS